VREMDRTDTRARYNRDELYLLTDLLVQLDFVYVYILFYFFIHYYSKAFIFYTTSTIDSSLFSNTVRVIIALKRSKPIYKTNCSDGHRPLFICDVLAQITWNIQLSRECVHDMLFLYFKTAQIELFSVCHKILAHTNPIMFIFVKYLSHLTRLASLNILHNFNNFE